jgi:hypothetical protein
MQRLDASSSRECAGFVTRSRAYSRLGPGLDESWMVGLCLIFSFQPSSFSLCLFISAFSFQVCAFSPLSSIWPQSGPTAGKPAFLPPKSVFNPALFRANQSQSDPIRPIGKSFFYQSKSDLIRPSMIAAAYRRQTYRAGVIRRTVRKHGLRLSPKHVKVDDMATSWVRKLFKRPAGAGLENTQSKADHGDAEAQFSLGLKFASGGPAWLDYDKAAHWYLLAANQNHALAQFNLGLMFAGGQGVARDEAQALMWIQKAAQQGDAGAQHHLGLRHRRASFEGLPKDRLESNMEAYKWFCLAAAQGYRASAGAREDIAIGFTRAQVDEGNNRADACIPARATPQETRP